MTIKLVRTAAVSNTLSHLLLAGGVVLRSWDNNNSQQLVDNWAMAKKRISDDLGLAALGDVLTQEPTAVRYLLQLLEIAHPGGTIELRVPPYGAVQLVGGMNHRRGTPPNVVELKPEDFLSLAQGRASWDELVDAGLLIASGARSDELRNLFPRGGVR